MTTRRDVLRAGLGAALLAGLPRWARALAADRPYLAAALDAERWIRAARQTTARGVTWPADPADPKSLGTTLYTHSPGVVLFYLELYAATRDPAHLAEARAGADHLMTEAVPLRLDQTPPGAPADGPTTEVGLYEGLTGVAFTLDQVARAGGGARYREAARRALRRIAASAREAGAGVEWGESTDIISGGAGVGLFLLYARQSLRDPAALALATRAGRRLVELAKPAEGGLAWAMTPSYPTLMPNFSHGTAGVSYFLATLYGVTRERAFLDAALAGAGHLRAIARCSAGGCLVHHHAPGGEDLFYLGWCHGPAGTARLFQRLGQVTGDLAWSDWVHRGARGITAAGAPARRSPGYWNNVSQCCGTAGIGDFFLSVHRLTKDPADLGDARRAVDELLARGTADEAGLRWVQAEHRVRPELLVAQTGWMQGAAGNAALLLHFDAVEQRRRRAVVFPDSPFVG